MQPPLGQPSSCLCLCSTLENNQITTLPADVFKDLTSLKWL
jgi:hypothetical protein